LVFSY